MKTPADFRRRVKVGTRLLCVENTYRPALNGTMRTVNLVEEGAFRWRQDGETFDSWTEFPKARDLAVLDANTVQYRLALRDGHTVRLRFVEG